MAYLAAFFASLPWFLALAIVVVLGRILRDAYAKRGGR